MQDEAHLRLTPSLSAWCLALWITRDFFSMKHLSQCSHTWGRSPECSFSCRLKFVLNENARPHSLQTKGLSPLCFTSWAGEQNIQRHHHILFYYSDDSNLSITFSRKYWILIIQIYSFRVSRLPMQDMQWLKCSTQFQGRIRSALSSKPSTAHHDPSPPISLVCMVHYKNIPESSYSESLVHDDIFMSVVLNVSWHILFAEHQRERSVINCQYSVAIRSDCNWLTLKHNEMFYVLPNIFNEKSTPRTAWMTSWGLCHLW